jgi:hypothetical protein
VALLGLKYEETLPDTVLYTPPAPPEFPTAPLKALPVLPVRPGFPPPTKKNSMVVLDLFMFSTVKVLLVVNSCTR